MSNGNLRGVNQNLHARTRTRGAQLGKAGRPQLVLNEASADRSPQDMRYKARSGHETQRPPKADVRKSAEYSLQQFTSA